MIPISTKLAILQKGITMFDSINSLGTTPAEVANSLKAQGIQGVKKDPGCCPVAIYSDKLLGNDADFKVKAGIHYIRVFSTVKENVADRTVQMVTPKPVAEFIKQFDCGLHPELEK